MDDLKVHWLWTYLRSLSLNEPLAISSPNDVISQNDKPHFEFTKNMSKHREKIERCSDDFHYFDSNISEEYLPPPVSVLHSEGCGRFLCASRDIEAGETIFWEPPLVLSPKGGSGPTCLDCFLSFTESNWPVCEYCGCPKCEENCEGNEHSEEECKILSAAFKDTSIRNNANLVKRLNIILTPLRTHLAILESPSYQNIINSLQSNAIERQNSSIGEFIENFVVSFFQNETETKLSPEFVHHVCGVFDTNAFDVTLGNQKQARALLPMAALMNHSCVPNTQHWFFHGYCIVRACLPIKKGEAITNSYTQALFGTKTRQNHLLLTKLFKCTCKRCQDPSELGSNFSSIRCQRCKKGLMTSPSSGTKGLPCSSCNFKMTSSEMSIINIASGIVSRAEDMDTKLIYKAIQTLDDMIGPQHYSTAKLKFIYLNKIVKYYQTAQVYELLQALPINDDLLELSSKIEPGMTRTRGILLFNKITIVTELATRHCSSMLPDEDRVEIQKLFSDKNVIEELEIISEDCEDILKWDMLLEAMQITRNRWKEAKHKLLC